MSDAADVEIMRAALREAVFIDGVFDADAEPTAEDDKLYGHIELNDGTTLLLTLELDVEE